MKPYFEYKLIPTSETSKLLSIEPKLGKYIDFTKPFNIRIMPNHYQCFIHTVISQQLSNAAVDTIWNKLVMYFKKIDPKTISKATHEQLAAVGLSPQKILLIKKMTYDIIDKRIDLDKLAKLSNDDIANILIDYKYIGRWTVAMLLIFTYYRRDIFAKEDYGFIKGLKILYGKKVITDTFLRQLQTKFIGYETLFTFCLWRVAYIRKTKV